MSTRRTLRALAGALSLALLCSAAGSSPPPGAALQLSAERAVLMPGQALPLRVTLVRSAGFSEAVQLTLAGLPAGVAARPAVVAAGQTQAEIELRAQATAPHSLPTTVTVEARAQRSGAPTVTSPPLTVTVRGPAGAVDGSFAGGAAITPVDIGEDHARAVAVQPDGRIVVAGASGTARGTRISLVRYLRDGSLDPGFGKGGKVLAAVGTAGNDAANAIALQPDGRIVVAGSADLGGGNTDFAVLRFHADGTPDTTFGEGGRRTLDFAGGADRAWALLIQDDGRIVVGGEANLGSATTGIDFALARLLPDGRLDGSFGQGGQLTTAIKAHAGTDVVRALAWQRVDGSDRLLAVGGEGDFLAARYTASGALDSGFASGGRLAGLFGDVIGAARAVVVLPTGEAVLAGHIGHRFAVAQLGVDGRPDARFGTQGRLVQAVVPGWNEATALVRQADGRLVVGGWAATGNSSSNDFAALRLLADGAPDRDFAAAGVLIAPTAAGTRNDQVNAMALQADERVPTVRAVLAGEANGANHDFALRRLWL